MEAIPPINTIFNRLAVALLQQKNEEVVKAVQGGRPEPPPLVAEDDYAGRPQRPEQSEKNKKKRTIAEVDLMPTEKQKTCSYRFFVFF